jgi:hypothetical protein
MWSAGRPGSRGPVCRYLEIVRAEYGRLSHARFAIAIAPLVATESRPCSTDSWIFRSLSPGTQSGLLGAVSLLLMLQAVQRYEDRSLFAFFLALAAIALSWFRFRKGLLVVDNR